MNADKCRSGASDSAKGIRVQRMASTSSNAPSRTSGRTTPAPSGAANAHDGASDQQETRTKLEPGHGHRIVMAQIALVQRVEHAPPAPRTTTPTQKPQVHIRGMPPDHQRDARESPGFRAEDYVVRSARP